MLESLSKKGGDPKVCSIIKKRLQCRCFPEEFAKFFRTPSFTEHLQWLLLFFSQQNNLIFSVIMINVRYTKNCHGNTAIKSKYVYMIALSA